MNISSVPCHMPRPSNSPEFDYPNYIYIYIYIYRERERERDYIRNAADSYDWVVVIR